MKKFVFAAAVAASLLYAPLAQAATVFDITLTGTFALHGSKTQVDGTGTITATGIGTGLQNASLTSTSPKITDVQIDLGLTHFDFNDAVFADLVTFNGNPLAFSYSGVTPAGAGFFDPKITFNTFGLDDFVITDSEHRGGNLFFGTFSISPAAIAGVPEPATWAMMLLGFGGIGAMLRMVRRKQDVLAAA